MIERIALAAVRVLAVLGMAAVVVPTVAIAGRYFGGTPAHSWYSWVWLVPVGQLTVALFFRIRVALTERHPPVPPRRRAPAAVLAALLVMLTVDVSKAWSLAFALPDMQREFGLGAHQVLLLPMMCVLGAVLSSFYFGVLADRFGTRTMAVFSALGCTGTALCGTTESFAGAALVCFVLGLAVGGLVPIVFALVPYVAPGRGTATSIVFAATATTAGYLLALGLAHALLPAYGWRGLWLSGAVTGPLLLAACLMLPDWVPGYDSPPRGRIPPYARRTAIAGYAVLAGALCVAYISRGPSLAGAGGLPADLVTTVQIGQSVLVLPAGVAVAFGLRRRSLGWWLSAIARLAGVAVVASTLALVLHLPPPALVAVLVVTGVGANLTLVMALAAAWHWYGRAGGVAGIAVVAGLVKVGGLLGPAAIGATRGVAPALVGVASALAVAAFGAAAAVHRAFGDGPVPSGGLDAEPTRTPPDRLGSPTQPTVVDVAVVGAGFAGICMAIALARAGFRNFVVLERASDIGGTWRDNTYPGCACDVPSNLYSYSFAPNPDWRSSFAGQPDIHRYLRHCVDRNGLAGHLRLDHEVTAASWDEARRRWLVETPHGALSARVLVCATGPLSDPSVPHLPGAETFTGTAFHSARWRHRHDLSGRRVAVIGTGASAAQFVPHIVDRVRALYVFQRTAPWVVPRWDRRRSSFARRLFRAVPVVQRAMRTVVYWGRESLMLGLRIDHRLLKVAEWLARWHLRRQVPDPTLRAALTPDYAVGCKRLVVSSDFYPALGRPQVELVTTPIAKVCPRGISTDDGVLRMVDTIIYATGFELANAPIAHRVTGRGRRRLADVWARGAEAYLGVAVHGFPNLFLLTGPNSLLGHNSAILGAEAQVRYVLDALRTMGREGLTDIEVTSDAQSAFVRDVDERMARTVWMSGCRSWYLDAAGRNSTLWPGFTAGLRRRTRRFDPSRFLSGRPGAPPPRPQRRDRSGIPLPDPRPRPVEPPRGSPQARRSPRR